MPIRPSASIVIPAHNCANTIVEQLDAAAGQQYEGSLEIVVVLNRCTDQTAQIVDEWCQAAAVPITVVIANEHAGASHARNAGVEASSGRVLLFCDADDVIQESWVSELVTALENADVVGGRFVAHPENSARVGRTFPLNAALQNEALPLLFGRLNFVVSASLACRRETFEALGGFPLNFPHGSEDIAFSILAQRAGFRLGFAPQAKCAYRWRRGVLEVARQRARYQQSHAQVVAVLVPEEDHGLLHDLMLFLRAAVRATIPFPLGLFVRRALLLRIQAAGLVAAHRLRREFRVAENDGSQCALVDVTAPIEWPLIGGLAFAAPSAIAASVRELNCIPMLLREIATIDRSTQHVVVIGDHFGLLATACSQHFSRQTNIYVATEPNPALAATQNANRHNTSSRLHHLGHASMQADHVADHELKGSTVVIADVACDPKIASSDELLMWLHRRVHFISVVNQPLIDDSSVRHQESGTQRRRFTSMMRRSTTQPLERSPLTLRSSSDFTYLAIVTSTAD